VDRLLETVEIAGLRFRNRMVHVPTTMNMSDPTGHVTDKLIGAYESIAAGGSSATIVGATCVRWDGLINERMLGMYDDTYVIGHRDLVEVIKHNGSLSAIQLFYGGLIPGLGATMPLKPNEGWIPNTIAWGPSDKIPLGNPQPLVMTTEVYDEVVEAFGQGARRAQEAGYDFLSLHFCHGSLPHTNLSLISNQGRNDAYADRFLLCERIIMRIQALCGKDFAIVPRLCCDENLEGGYDIDYFAENYATRLHALGVAAIDCTFGSMLPVPSRNPEIHSTEFIGPGFYTRNVINLENIRHLRRRLIDLGIDMPLIGSANLGTPDHLRTMVSEGAADFAGVCRLSLDDPDYARKIAEGREREVRRSTRTGASLLQGNIFGKGWAGSAQNPSFGRDREYRIRITAAPRKVVVVGGGSGGMEYAIAAHQAGHDVMLFERDHVLGGAMEWAGNYKAVPNMEMIRYQPDFHRSQIERWSVPHRLGAEADAKTVLAEKPDVVVVATGAAFPIPNIEGMERATERGFAVSIRGAMARERAPRPKRPVVLGAGMGSELAIDFALQGLPVRLIDPAPQFTAANYLGSRAPNVTVMLSKLDVPVDYGVTVQRIGDHEIIVRHGDGRFETIETDLIVYCLARRPLDQLARDLSQKQVHVQVLGDARAPRSYGNAIHEAAYLARRL
jgi:2,4-dienoyl-CoA reductase-like NADH-dependent reductase (Old Yellow Enzyme family)/thioredoxin reductase